MIRAIVLKFGRLWHVVSSILPLCYDSYLCILLCGREIAHDVTLRSGKLLGLLSTPSDSSLTGPRIRSTEA